MSTAPYAKTLPKGHETHVKASDQRRLREKIKDAFALVQPAQLDAIMPKKASVSVVKIDRNEEIVFVDGQPMFFNVGDIPFAPTCYALHVAPQILRQVVVFPGLDSAICRSGAPLFLPGIYRDKTLAELKDAAQQQHKPWTVLLLGGDFKKNELCSLVVAGSWAPFAVGRFALSPAEMAKQQSHESLGGLKVVSSDNELKGLAVEVIHYITDALWTAGSRVLPPEQVPEDLIQWASSQTHISANSPATTPSPTTTEAHTNTQVRDQLVAKRNELQAECASLSADVEAIKCIRQARESSSRPPTKSEKSKLAREQDIAKAFAEAQIELAEVVSALEALAPTPDPAENNHNHNSGGDEDDDNSNDDNSNDDNSNDDNSNDDNSNDGSDDKGNESDASHHSANNSNNVEARDATKSSVSNDQQTNERELVDSLFQRALFTVISREPLPMLASAAFAKASQLAGDSVSIKQTKWKKAALFLADHAQVISTTQSSPGVFSITSFNAAALQMPFEPLEANDAQTPTTHITSERFVATKKGQPVTANGKNYRGKHVTLVDGLEKWGLTKDGMEDMARDFRKKLSTSVSVGVRAGTHASDKELWTLQIQGLMRDELAVLLRERGVTSVTFEGLVSGKAKKKGKK